MAASDIHIVKVFDQEPDVQAVCSMAGRNNLLPRLPQRYLICAPLEPARRVISGIAICFSPLWKSSRARASNWLIRSTGEPGSARVGKWPRDEDRITPSDAKRKLIRRAGSIQRTNWFLLVEIRPFCKNSG